MVSLTNETRPGWCSAEDALKEAIESTKQKPGLHLADLLEEIKYYLARYVYFPDPPVASLVACWIAMTYCFEEFYYSGYLAIHSELPGSGKTQLLDVLSALSKGNPPVITSPTPAVLYRANRGVWLIDEVDNLGERDRDSYGMVIAVLNAGFKRGGQVIRNERNSEGGFTPIYFPVYGPKGFAGLRALSGTLVDRSFPIEMTKAPYRLPRLHYSWYSEVAARIRQDMEVWFGNRADTVRKVYSELPSELPFLRGYDHRFQDIAEPLLTLAVVADAEAGSASRHLSSVLMGLRIVGSKRLTDEGINTVVLESAGQMLNGKNECFVRSKDLLGRCMENRLTQIPTEKALGTRLSKFGLSSRSNGTVRGYDVSKGWLEDAQRNVSGLGAAPAVGF
jgi:hypothetical protein